MLERNIKPGIQFSIWPINRFFFSKPWAGVSCKYTAGVVVQHRTDPGLWMNLCSLDESLVKRVQPCFRLTRGRVFAVGLAPELVSLTEACFSPHVRLVLAGDQRFGSVGGKKEKRSLEGESVLAHGFLESSSKENASEICSISLDKTDRVLWCVLHVFS